MLHKRALSNICDRDSKLQRTFPLIRCKLFSIRVHFVVSSVSIHADDQIESQSPSICTQIKSSYVKQNYSYCSQSTEGKFILWSTATAKLITPVDWKSLRLWAKTSHKYQHECTLVPRCFSGAINDRSANSKQRNNFSHRSLRNREN